MEQLIQSLITAGTDASKIERARHRGLAYQCLKCLQRDGTRTINIKCRMEEHVMHAHLGKAEWHFYCKLCGFKCRKYEELTTHLTAYRRHVVKATKEKILDHRPYLVENPMPHVFGPADYRPLTPEASLLHFLGMGDGEVNEGVGRPSSRPQLTQAALQATLVEMPVPRFTPTTTQAIVQPTTQTMPLGLRASIPVPTQQQVQSVVQGQGQWAFVGPDGKVLVVTPAQPSVQMVQSPSTIQPTVNAGGQVTNVQPLVTDQRIVVLNSTSGTVQGPNPGQFVEGANCSGDAILKQAVATVFSDSVPAILQQGAE